MKFLLKNILLLLIIPQFTYGQNIDSIVKAYNQLKPTAEKVNFGNKWTKSISYSNPDKAIYLAKINLKLAKKLNYKNGIANSLGCYGWAYDFKGNLDSAVHYYSSATIMHKTLGNNKESADNLNNLGVVYYINGDYTNAMVYYTQTIEQRKLLNDDLGLSKVYNNMGLISYKLENYSQAIGYYEKSFLLKQNLGDSIGMFNSLGNISNSYLFLDNIDKTIYYSNLTEEFAIALNDNFTLATLKIDRALIYKKLGKIDLAIKEAEESIIALEKLPQKNFKHLEEAYHNLSTFYNEKGKYKKAITTAFKALEIARELGKRETEQNIYYSLSNSYSKLNNWEKAFEFSQKGEQLKNTLFNEKTSKSFAEISIKYKLDSIKRHEETRIKIEQQKAITSELLRKEEAEKNFYFRISLVIIIFFLVLLAIFYIVILKSKKELLNKNTIIENSLDEKEVLMREIHHRVKNNIQSIKSIISIQKRNSNSSDVVHSLGETLNRINAMSLIHDKLYKPDKIIDIDSGTYINQLSSTIFKSFGFYLNKNLEFSFNYNKITLPIDNLLIFGLIVNEIITNSCKYGVSKDGILRINFEIFIKDKMIYVQISDFGKGKTLNEKSSFGLDLINALVYKLKGKIKYIEVNKGHKIQITFPFND